MGIFFVFAFCFIIMSKRAGTIGIAESVYADSKMIKPNQQAHAAIQVQVRAWLRQEESVLSEIRDWSAP